MILTPALAQNAASPASWEPYSPFVGDKKWFDYRPNGSGWGELALLSPTLSSQKREERENSIGGLLENEEVEKGRGASPSSPAPSSATPVPHIQFAMPVFDFGKVEAGQVVKHDFAFTNTGSALLEIHEVRTTCGCAAAGSWDRQVAPGKTGVIPIQMNTTGYRGGVVKTISVLCNDPAQSNVVLQLKGTLWALVDVLPSMAYFAINSDTATNQTKVVRILNYMEESLIINEIANTNRALQTELKTVIPGKEFQLLITAIPPFSSRIPQSPIVLKTSSKRLPEIAVNTYVMVQPSVTTTPSQIALPDSPSGPIQSIVSIRNTGQNPLVLSEPHLNITNITLQLQEPQPGRLFHLLINFPAGFQLPSKQPGELSVKTSHPQFPIIRVPIRQTLRPVRAVPIPSPAANSLTSTAPRYQAATIAFNPITVTPAAVLFSIPRDTQASETKTVRILNKDTNPITMSSPICTNQVIKTDLRTIHPGKEFELRITAVPPFTASSLQTSVKLNTSSLQMPSIVIPAAIIVR